MTERRDRAIAPTVGEIKVRTEYYGGMVDVRAKMLVTRGSPSVQMEAGADLRFSVEPGQPHQVKWVGVAERAAEGGEMRLLWRGSVCRLIRPERMEVELFWDDGETERVLKAGYRPPSVPMDIWNRSYVVFDGKTVEADARIFQRLGVHVPEALLGGLFETHILDVTFARLLIDKWHRQMAGMLEDVAPAHLPGKGKVSPVVIAVDDHNLDQIQRGYGVGVEISKLLPGHENSLETIAELAEDLSPKYPRAMIWLVFEADEQALAVMKEYHDAYPSCSHWIIMPNSYGISMVEFMRKCCLTCGQAVFVERTEKDVGEMLRELEVRGNTRN